MEKAAPLLEACPSECSSTSPAAPVAAQGDDQLNKLPKKVVAGAPEEEEEKDQMTEIDPEESKKKLKGKAVCEEEEEKSSESEKPLREVSSTRGILELKLPSDHEEDKCEDDNFEMSPTDASNDVGEPSAVKAKKENDEIRFYTCNYCQRKFPSSQALGGHQNAHRQAQQLAKERLGPLPSFDPPPPLPSNYRSYYAPHYSSTFPQERSMYGGTSSTFNRSPLGVRADSMIHKTSPRRTSSTPMGLAMGYRFGQPAINPRPTHDVSLVDRLKMELASPMYNNNNNNNHSFGMAAPSTFQGSAGNVVWNFMGVPPKNYSGLNLGLNNGSGSSWNSSLLPHTAAITGDAINNQQSDESLSDLDLDLKL